MSCSSDLIVIGLVIPAATCVVVVEADMVLKGEADDEAAAAEAEAEIELADDDDDEELSGSTIVWLK